MVARGLRAIYPQSLFFWEVENTCRLNRESCTMKVVQGLSKKKKQKTVQFLTLYSIKNTFLTLALQKVTVLCMHFTHSLRLPKGFHAHRFSVLQSIVSLDSRTKNEIKIATISNTVKPTVKHFTKNDQPHFNFNQFHS